MTRVASASARDSCTWVPTCMVLKRGGACLLHALELAARESDALIGRRAVSHRKQHGGVAVGLAATGFGLCGAAGSLTFAAFGVMALANVTNKELEERSKDDRGPSTSVLEMAARPLQRALARVFGPRSRRALGRARDR